MARRAAVLHLLLELEDDELRAELLAQHRAADAGPVDGRRPHRDGLAVADEQDAVEGDRSTGLRRQPLDDELAAGLDAILLPAGRHDGVHVCSPGTA
jgi:hypothetical protein